MHLTRLIQIVALVSLLFTHGVMAQPDYEAWSRVCVEIFTDGRQNGSGTVVDEKGIVLTASHFLEKPGAYVEVVSGEGERHPARVLAIDHGHDLALLQIVNPKAPLAYAKLAEALPVPGTDVYLYSAALFRHGVLNKASVARATPYYEYMGNKYNAIIHLAGTSPGGSSGGSWMNEAGEIIGVQSGNMTMNGAPLGVSMVGPLSAIKKLLKSRTHANTPTLNTGLEELWAQETAFIRAYEGENGLVIRQLKAGGALAQAGVKEWDVITQLNGKPVSFIADALDVIRQHAPGEVVKLQVTDAHGQHRREAEVTLGCLEHAWRAAKKPNVIVVLTDDMGMGDLGFMGNTDIRTPHIDALGKRSARMENFYVHAVCAPTRACTMTGRYNYRTRVVDTWIGRAMMDPDEQTLAEVLRAGGYATGIFGKWHLGDAYPLRAMDQGFDEALVHWGGGLAQPAEPRENADRYTNPLLSHNGRTIETEGFCTDVFFDRAIDWMERRALSGKPFFTYLPTNAPHGPLHDVPEALYQAYVTQGLDDRTARIFAMIENIDQNMGKLDAFLERTGIRQDTLLIYFHDNGPEGKRFNAGCRGSKTEVYEGGIRSPLFVEWPGHVNGDEAFSPLAAHIDLFPTILEAADVELPTGLKIDGRSILPILQGKDVKWPNRQLILQSHRGDAPVRYHQFAIRQGAWKLLRASGFGRVNEDAPFELYDLEKDPGETTNLYEAHPKVVKRLKAAYDLWFDDVSSTREDNYAPPRIILGNSAETETALTHQDWRNVTGPGWGTNGEWLVDVERKGVFDVDVVLRKTLTEGEITLTIGEASWNHTIEKAADKIHFKGLSLPKGAVTIKSTIELDKVDIGPDRLIVFKR
jgi:arylsulfatase A-like enzyme/S1-C subfamily serine protease